MKRSIRLAASLFCGFALIAASQASATTTHLYAEILTSNQEYLLPDDVAVRVDLAYPGGSPVTTLAEVEDGAGLGDGYVADGGVKEFTHYFRPTGDVSEIVSASLAISVMDDQFGDESERLDITLDGDLFATGMATFAFFYNEIKAELFEKDGHFNVVVTSTGGDFTMLSSMFKVIYLSADGTTPSTSGNGTGTVNAVPEPFGFTLYAMGATVLVAARHRRSSRRG